MVKVIFYNLLRSKYRIKEEDVKSGSILQIVSEIISKHPEMKKSDFESSVVFYKGNPIHFNRFDTLIDEGEEIIITHFVGGG